MEHSWSEVVSLYGPCSHKQCTEYALVLKSVGIPCQVLPGDGGYHLMVQAQDVGQSQEQLQLYLDENRVRLAHFDSHFRVYDGLVCACLYGLTILLVDIFQRDQVFSLDWWRAGMSQAGLIRAGEWWRVMTALSLHADTFHLISNLAFGLVFGFFAGELLGWGLAWFGMLLAGALGNTINALVQAPDHVSIGASTAVFATLGILAAYTWKRRRTRINRWVPLAAGVALLAFLGMGGERTDIFAHLAGFGSGGLFGLIFGITESHSLLAARYKHILGLATSLLFAAAWALALLAHG